MIAVPKDALTAISGQDDVNLRSIASISSALIKVPALGLKILIKCGI